MKTGVANLPLHGGKAPNGGKDGIPYPVDKKVYEQSIEILEKAIRKAKVSPYEKRQSPKEIMCL